MRCILVYSMHAMCRIFWWVYLTRSWCLQQALNWYIFFYRRESEDRLKYFPGTHLPICKRLHRHERIASCILFYPYPNITRTWVQMGHGSYIVAKYHLQNLASQCINEHIGSLQSPTFSWDQQPRDQNVKPTLHSHACSPAAASMASFFCFFKCFSKALRYPTDFPNGWVVDKRLLRYTTTKSKSTSIKCLKGKKKSSHLTQAILPHPSKPDVCAGQALRLGFHRGERRSPEIGQVAIFDI